MALTKAQRREAVLDKYATGYVEPPLIRCSDCAAVDEKLMEIKGRLLCKKCVMNEMDSDSDVISKGVSKIYYLMERLATAENKHKSGIICSIWESIEVLGITVNRGRNENFYHIKLLDGEIVLNEKDSLTCTQFRIDFQRIHGVLLPNLPYTQWACLVTEWLKMRKFGVEVEEISEHQEIIDAIVENITSSRLIKGTGISIFGTVYYHDDAILVPNETIKNLAGKINRNLRLRKVSNIVSDYLLGPTKTYRTPEGVVRMWRFDPVQLNIDVKDAIELDVEGDGDE